VVRRLTPTQSDALLVGTATGDDAAVWKLDESRALVVTADFITPVVDDARTWGRVAAANSVSDVYAMGGKPILALNLVGWNVDALGTDLLAEVLAGGDDTGRAGGFHVVGGHTIDDPEPKYGMAVVGEVHPDRILTNAGLRPDQALILTKPLGVGIITTAIKADAASKPVADAAVTSMSRLNDVAATVAADAGATGCTDVTGFGLLGHLGRMAAESAVDVELAVSDVPYLPGARDLAAAGMVPGGTRRNLHHISDQLEPGGHDELEQLLLADAQTSGGLVFGVPRSAAEGVLEQLWAADHVAALIGRTTAGRGMVRLR
jgi:selenide,water dikinase